MTDDIGKAFDKALGDKIDERAGFLSRVDSLKSNIRNCAELCISSQRVDPKKAASQKGQLQPYVDASVAMVLDEARFQVARIVEKETGVSPPEHLIPDACLVPFIDIFEAKCLNGIKAAFA
jgi:hypothetical protein